MLEKIIDISLQNKLMVIILTMLLLLAGVYCMKNIPLDAIPDLSDVQVTIYTEHSGQAPQVIENQITYPLTTAMLSVPYAKVVRGYSFFGFSLVSVIFEDGTDLYWARSRVLEYLNFVSGRLPAGINPSLGPDATGVGWVYEYALVDKSGRHDLSELRSIQDWYMKYELQTVPGVSEVASIGGYVKQYQVEIDPNRLSAYNIPLTTIKKAIQQSNSDVGGKLLEMAETEFMVRGLGYIKSIDDIKNIPVGVDANGTPVLVQNIATVQTGPELRRGMAEIDGKGEVVGGIVVMRYGENALQVITDVKKRIDKLQAGLPEGIEIVTVYDRSGLIKRGIDTLKKTLTEELLIVSLVCIVFLLHLRSSFVSIFVLPTGIALSFIIMYLMNINANIMSLGGIAIAIGVMVDSSVVMVENVFKHLERDQGKKEHWDIIADASKEVGPSLFFALLIITLSFLPVFTLEAQEGRLFKPLAYTKTFAMASSSVLAITVIPVLMGFFIKGKIIPERKHPINRICMFLYRPIINFSLHHKSLVLFCSVLLTGMTIFPYQKIGSEFMPPLNEGDLLYMPTTLPGISITKAKELLQQTDRIIKTFPEVKRVFGKVGRAETATDPAPLSMIETTITLHPQEKWREGMTIEKLTNELNTAISFPGLTNAWTMPIKTRVDMLSTGIKTPVGIKISGNNLETLQKLGKKIESVIKKIPGTLSVYSERVIGGNYVDFTINRKEAARYGLTVGDIQDIIKTAIGGMNITNTVEGRERYPVNIRYGRELRDTISSLKRVLVPTPRGEHIPITQVADIAIKKGPPAIKSENARLNALVYVDITDIDIGTYVKNAKRVVNEQVSLPPGYTIFWSGQYEYMERAVSRLKLVIPGTLLIIFLLLYINFNNVTESLIVMFSIPFSLIGGIWCMYLLGYNLSVAAGVGFIALAGLTVETGIVMLVYLDESYKKKYAEKKDALTSEDVYDAVREGAVLRIRPILMTVGTTLIGLMPIMRSSQAGSQAMKRLAAPMIGGLITATLLTLIIIPIVYAVTKKSTLRQ